ncbi:MAG: response regulator transcription factor [Alphaproteobacteria bacterium]|nr:response regulator transcription factor [Alphaproteobacteria bacterium]MCB9698415.1 response regulator transcription factor [Alphaproteobacteria bacterium]
MPRVLIVEDDEATRTLVATYLTREGFEVLTAGDGPSALTALTSSPPDVVVLDWMLPEMDGIAVCKAARERWTGPILMLTARNEDVDEVVALEVGVDDFLAKPVRARVLLARLRALLRRNALPSESDDRIVLGDLVVDKTRREVTVRDVLVSLTTADFDLVWELARRAGEPVEREDLFRALRGIEYDGLDRAIDMRVSQLRKKLRDALPTWDDPIRTVRGVGYQLVRP